jgi:hypothetical protein
MVEDAEGYDEPSTYYIIKRAEKAEEESNIKLTNGVLEHIHLFDDKKRTHILALEMI